MVGVTVLVAAATLVYGLLAYFVIHAVVFHWDREWGK